MTTPQRTHYDVGRAIAAGEFGEEVDLGKGIALALYSTVSTLSGAGETATAYEIISATIARVAEEFYDDNPSGNPVWLSVMHNSVTAMYRDLLDQYREATDARRPE